MNNIELRIEWLLRKFIELYNGTPTHILINPIDISYFTKFRKDLIKENIQLHITKIMDMKVVISENLSVGILLEERL